MNSTATAPFSLHNDPPIDVVAEFPRVIRRDIPGDASGKPRVVEWLGHKIDHAVRAEALACHEDIAICQQVQAENEFRMRKERPSFVQIEHLQDLVEETLMELGHGKVA